MQQRSGRNLVPEPSPRWTPRSTGPSGPSARCRLDLKDALATGRGVVRAEGMLRLAEQRLARLRESREVLLVGELS